MKFIFRSAAIAVLILTTSCGKDTAEAIADIVDEEVEQLESTPLEVNSITDNVIIAGGTKEEGDSPIPNGAISLDLSNASKTALLGEGFDIPFSSDGDIVGAYLRFKADDGTVADSYYDIDLDANSTDNKSSKRKIYRFKNSNSLSAKTDAATLDIDFNTTIEPGTFCYEICVYDANGNISNPQEVCVTVESWGGSNEILGDWNLVKEVETINGVTGEVFPGDVECTQEITYDCDGGGQVAASYHCYITDTFSLVLNEDGTYIFDSKDKEKELDADASKASCDAVYDEFDDNYLSEGNWAYVKDKKQLIMVEYQYTEDYRNEIETETYEKGDAPLLFEGEVRLENGSLIIAIDEDSNDSYLIYLEK